MTTLDETMLDETVTDAQHAPGLKTKLVMVGNGMAGARALEEILRRGGPGRTDPMSSDHRCRATNRHGQPCGQPPVPGALVCHYHGGAAGQVKRKAAVRVAEAKARTILDGHRVTPVTDPLTALMEVAGEVVAFKVYLSERAGELASSADSDEERATLGAYERALDRCGRILVDMAKLNLDERMTRLAEGQAQMLGAVVLSVLSSTELALTETQLTTARNAIATELLALDAGEAS